jgi:hypothetical protein
VWTKWPWNTRPSIEASLKVDVVCCYYNQLRNAEVVFRGWNANRDSIGTIFIVNDDMWAIHEEEHLFALARKHNLKVRFLEHPRPEGKWHGVGKSFNQGIQASESEYIFLTAFDQVLPLEAIQVSAEVAAPERVVLGEIHSIGLDPLPEDYPCYLMMRQDPYTALIEKIEAGELKIYDCMVFHNGHMLLHKPTHERIGGFNELYCAIGYGLEDIDYCFKMLTEFDRETAVVYNGSYSYSISLPEPGIKDPKKYPSPAAYVVLNRTYTKYLDAYNVPKEKRPQIMSHVEITAYQKKMGLIR